VHVGVAVALRVADWWRCIMDTAGRPLAALMNDFRDLVARARAGRLRASELAAPTLILTSLGEASSKRCCHHPAAPGRDRRRRCRGSAAMGHRWQSVPRRVLTLSLGADHRVTDGRLGAHFLARIAALLADPAQL